MKSLRTLIISGFLLVFFLSFGVSRAGFGVSPGVIEENKLVPGASLERVIYLVQGNQNQDVLIKAVVESKDIGDWITFVDGDEFTIPANQQQYPLKVLIKVPEDAKLGAYSAFVRVTTVPKQVDGTQVTIALGGKVNIKLEVGDDIIQEYSIRSLEIFDIKEGDRPKVGVTISNTGNVPVAPENASFELFNKYGEIRLAYGENDKFTKVPAFSDGVSMLEFPLDVKLGVGEYWGHVKIYSNGKAIKELRTVFNVTERSFVEKNLYSIITVVVAAIIVFVYFFFRRKRKLVA